MTEIFGIPTQALFGQLLIGLINGSFYALLSLGLAVIFGLLNIINFTHGAQYMLGAFCAFLLLNKLGVGYWWSLAVVPLIVTLRAQIESEEPPKRLRASARAEHLTMAIDVALRGTATGTELISVFDVKGEGQLKAIVDRLFERRATERTAQFAECLGRRFGAAPPAPAAVPAAVPPASALWRWLARLWQRLLGRSAPPR